VFITVYSFKFGFGFGSGIVCCTATAVDFIQYSCSASCFLPVQANFCPTLAVIIGIVGDDSTERIIYIFNKAGANPASG